MEREEEKLERDLLHGVIFDVDSALVAAGFTQSQSRIVRYGVNVMTAFDMVGMRGVSDKVGDLTAWLLARSIVKERSKGG
jgi:hypothetical protein